MDCMYEQMYQGTFLSGGHCGTANTDESKIYHKIKESIPTVTNLYPTSKVKYGKSYRKKRSCFPLSSNENNYTNRQKPLLFKTLYPA